MEWISIPTEYLGFFGDHIEIFKTEDEDTILLSDDGETLTNLKLTLGYA